MMLYLLPRLLTTGEVAKLFGVSGRTIHNWAMSGRIAYIRTPGGNLRFRETDVQAVLDGNGGDRR